MRFACLAGHRFKPFLLLALDVLALPLRFELTRPLVFLLLQLSCQLVATNQTRQAAEQLRKNPLRPSDLLCTFL